MKSALAPCRSSRAPSTQLAERRPLIISSHFVFPTDASARQPVPGQRMRNRVRLRRQGGAAAASLQLPRQVLTRAPWIMRA